ncbi:MAG: PilZ domain-containing protein [Polyangiaceae bacterium]|nr:PilZ domain-containing protein [Polyangiaceae bacterium]
MRTKRGVKDARGASAVDMRGARDYPRRRVTSSPPPSSSPPGALRRSGGGRVSFDRRAVIVHGDRALDAWSMNVSRGGLRVVMEDALAAGDEVDVVVGEPDEPDYFRKAARVAWVQPEQGGFIVGFEFKDGGSAPSIPAAPAPAGEPQR